ncbi:MAG: hypothetical protein AAF988_05570, partial [Pseudomonadota bacterium]
MGAIAPVAAQAVGAFNAVNSVISAVRPIAGLISNGSDFFGDRDERESDLALAQLQSQQRLSQQQAEQKAALDKQEILAKAEEAESKRRQALKRAVARQRAQFGARGVSSQGG